MKTDNVKEELIIKFLNNECSPEELKQVSRWLEDEDHEKELREMLVRRWENTQPEKLTDRNKSILGKIHKKLEERGEIPSSGEEFTSLLKDIPGVQPHINKRKNRDYSYFVKIAASVLIFIFSGAAFIGLLTRNDSGSQTSAERMVRKETGYGEKLRVLLPDGSKVTMNSGAAIEYPQTFNNSERVVKLSGEAFFEVTHNKEKPFRVVTELMETTVLGTRFNVNEEEDKVQVTLAEGKVLVKLNHAENSKTAQLSPGQMAQTEKDGSDLLVKQVDIADVTAWADGVIVFKSVPLGEILDKLEEWYAVDITLDEKIDTQRKVSGEFNNENLQNILTGLSFSMEFQYSINGKKVIIKKNKL